VRNAGKADLAGTNRNSRIGSRLESRSLCAVNLLGRHYTPKQPHSSAQAIDLIQVDLPQNPEFGLKLRKLG
jgi:hypothetical protein